MSAGGAEALAPVVSNWLYGKDAKELTADEKATVSNIVSLGAAGLTAGVGGAGADVVSSSQLASSAVEDNSGGHRQVNLALKRKGDRMGHEYQEPIPSPPLSIRDYQSLCLALLSFFVELSGY